MTKYFHFLDKATGEYFFVVNDNLRDATAHANGWYEDPCLVNITNDKNVVITSGEDVW